MSTFARRQIPVLILVAAISAWLVAVPMLLRWASVAPLNQPVSVASGSEITAIVKVDQGGEHDCALMFEPDGSVLDELFRAYMTHVTHELPPAPGALRLDIECTAYRVDRRDVLHASRTYSSEDFDLRPSIHLSRFSVSTYSGFSLSRGVYVVKAALKGDRSALARFHFAARLDLLPAARRPPSWRDDPRLPLAVAMAGNPLLVVLVGALCGLLLWRSLVSVFQPMLLAVAERAFAHWTAAEWFKALPGGKKKLVIAAPVVLLSLALVYLPSAHGIDGLAGVAFVVALATFLVGMIESRWSTGLARWSRAYAGLPAVLRGLLAFATVIAVVLAAMWFVSRFATLIPS